MSAAMLILAVLTVAYYLRVASLAYGSIQPPFQRTAHGSPLEYHGIRGAVASKSKICSKIGVDILRADGNAADAMVATVFRVGVIGMYHSGIGGGRFALIRSPNGTYDFVDFREAAPAAAFEDMFAVPGELRGLEYLSKAYGRLPWKHLLQPAIKAARTGSPVGTDLLRYIDFGDTEFSYKDPAWAQDFAPNGTLVGAGDTMTRRRYADIARTTVNAVQRAGGILTLEDLESYSVKIREPLTIKYRGFKLTGCEAPSSGAVTLSALKLIERYGDIAKAELLNLSSHRIIEAVKFGYGMRQNLGDPYFLNNTSEYQEQMISAQTAAENQAKISDLHTLNSSEYDPNVFQSLEDDGISHITLADDDGMFESLHCRVYIYRHQFAHGYNTAMPDSPGTIPRYYWPVTVLTCVAAGAIYCCGLKALQLKFGEHRTLGAYVGFEVNVYNEGDEGIPDNMKNIMADALIDGLRRRVTYKVSGPTQKLRNKWRKMVGWDLIG